MNLENIENLDCFKILKHNFLIVNNEDKLIKMKFLLKLIQNLTINYNRKIAILNSSIPHKTIIISIINKQIKVNKIKNLSIQQSKSNVEKIKNMIKNNIYINYTTETYIDELIEKCQYLKNIKKVDIITISNIERIKDLNEENKQEFFKKLEKISIQLKITILLII